MQLQLQLQPKQFNTKLGILACSFLLSTQQHTKHFDPRGLKKFDRDDYGMVTNTSYHDECLALAKINGMDVLGFPLSTF